LAIALAGASLGCGASSGGDSKFANVKAGEMPQGEDWTGVYYNTVYGYLHLAQQDQTIVGRWKRTDSSHWGELSGTREGNVLRFTWKEHKYGMTGPAAESHGSGVFVYKKGEAAPEVDGKYSLDGADDVGDWHMVKQNGMKPDLGSIGGDNPADVPATQDKWK
jgi:hypothetical protein